MQIVLEGLCYQPHDIPTTKSNPHSRSVYKKKGKITVYHKQKTATSQQTKLLECQELGIITFKSEKENTHKINVFKIIKDIKVGNKTLRGKYEGHSDVKISQIELEMNIIIIEIKVNRLGLNRD